MLSESSSWAACLYCLTQPFSTGAILTVDGGPSWPDHHRATNHAMDKMLTGRARFRMVLTTSS